MASYTTHLRLRKPDPTDPAIIDVINDNMDVLDAAIGTGVVPPPPPPPPGPVDPPPVAAVPTAPTGLMAAPGSGRITLVWFAPASDGGSPVLDYELQRAVAGGAFAVLQPGVLTTDYQDTGLANAVEHTYTVRARNSVGYGPASTPATATPVAPPQAPGIPRALSATVAGAAVTLSWSPPSTVPADTYTVKRNGVVVTGATGLQATSYTDSGLAPATYTYVVFGTNGVGPGPDSAPVTATVAAAEVLVYDAEVAADLPTLHVKLDEDTGGTFLDSSGNGHTGTLGGVGHTNNVPGPLASGDTGALRLAGAAYVSFGDVGDFINQSNFAVGVLVKPDALPAPNYSRIVAKEAFVSATGQNNGWALQIKPDGTPQGAFHAGASSVYLETSTPLATDNFNHVVLARSGTTASLILNGAVVATATVTLNLVDHAQPLTVGAGRTSTGTLFNHLYGVVSRVAVYPSALTEARAGVQARAVPLSAVVPVAPAAPTGVTATAGDGQVTLSWNAAAGAASYAVRWGTTTGVYPNEAQGITSTGRIVTGLTNGTPYFFVVHAENTAGRGPASAQVGATPVATPVVGTTIQAQIDATATSGTLNIAPGSYDAKDIGTGVVSRAMTIRGGSNVQIWGSDIWASWTGTGPWTSGTGNTFSGVVPAMSMSFGAGNDIDSAPELHWPEQVFIEDAAASPEGWRELQQVDESQVTVGAGQFKLANRTTNRRVVIGENPAGKRIRVTVRTHLLDVQASDVTITGLSGPTAGAGTVPLDGIRFRHCGPNYQRGTINWRGSYARGTAKWLDIGYSHGPAVAMYHTVAGGNADFNLQGNYLHHCGMGLDAGGEWNNTASGNPAWGFLVEDNTIAYCNRYAGNGGWHYAGIKITLWGGKAGHPAVMRRNDVYGTVWGAPGAWLDTYTPGWTIGGTTEADGNRFHDNEGYGFRNEINDALDLGSDAMVVRWNKTYNNKKAGIYVDVVKDITVRDNHSAFDGVVWDGTQNGINNSVGIDIHWFTGRGDMAVVDSSGPFNNVVQDNTVVTTSNRLLVAWRRDNGGDMQDASNYGTGNRYAVTNSAGAGTGGAIVAESGVSRWQAYNTVAPTYRYYTTLSSWVATKYGGLGRTPDSYFSNIAAVQAHLVARQLPTTPGGQVGAPPATAPAFYVSKLGGGADGLSWATAWLELDQIDWSKVTPGSTIYVDGGATSMTYTTQLAPTASGTATAPITIKLSNESGRNGQAIFSGGRSMALPYGGQASGYSYVDSAVTQVVKVTTSYIVIDGTYWSYNAGVPKCGIRIQRGRTSGIDLANGSSNCTFKYLDIADNGWATVYGAAYGVDGYGCQPAGSNHLFQRCLVRDNGQDGFQTYGNSTRYFTNLTLKECWICHTRRDVADKGWNVRAGTDPDQHTDGFQIATDIRNSGLTVLDCVCGPDFNVAAFNLGNESPDGKADNVTIRGTLFYGMVQTITDGGAATSFATGSYTYERCTFDASNNARMVCSELLTVTEAFKAIRKVHVINSVFTGNAIGPYINVQDAGSSTGNIHHQCTNGTPPASSALDPVYQTPAKAYGYGELDADFRATAGGAAGKGCTYGRPQDLMALAD